MNTTLPPRKTGDEAMHRRVQEVLASAPPMSAAQQDRIRELLSFAG